MKSKTLRLLSMLCTLVFLISLVQVAPFGVSALGSDIKKLEVDRTAPECDVSVMTFNILEYDTSNVGYDTPINRAPNVVDTIKNYMPDIVGIQEAAEAGKKNGYLDWNAYLEEKLYPLGYEHRQLSDESACPSSGLTIGAGLMIFYKADRFELIESDSEQYGGSKGVTGTDGTNSQKDTSRYFQWVKLWDNEYETFVYVFNTHLAINSSISGADNLKIGCHKRTQQLKQLTERMVEYSANIPCFATGDYNCKWGNSTEDDTYYHQLYYMKDTNIFGDGAADALNQLNTSVNNAIDHVFYNKTTTRILEYRSLYEDYNSYQPSDHKAMIGYFNYIPEVSFGSGKFDLRTKQLTDTTDDTKYTFDITLPDHTSYKIYDSDGKRISDNTITLAKKINKFTIKFYNPDATESNSREISSVEATITCTATLPPTVTSPQAINSYYGKDALHLLTDGDTVTLSVTGGTLTDTSATVTGLRAGTTTYHVKSDAGEIIPLYIHRATGTAKEGKVLYLDDDIGKATGTVAFTNDEDVIFVTAGTNGFSSFTDCAAVANTADGYTVYVAPGYYTDQNSVTFTKDITLLGNNHQTQTMSRTDTNWVKLPRKSLSIIDNNIIFNKGSNQAVTVRGFEFVGVKVYGPLVFNGGTYKNVLTLDIAHNTFDIICTYTVNGSCFNLNNAVQKTGRIYDNYFANNNKTDTTSSRLITCRNPNGLIFEENYCIGFSQESRQCFYFNSELSAGSKDALGNCNIIIQNNFFDYCSGLTNYTANVGEKSQANIVYRYNDFVRCGYMQGSTLFFNLTETAGVPNYYENASVTIYGNRFYNCYRAIAFTRSSNMQSDMRKMDIIIEQNRFVDMNQYQTYRSILFSIYAGTDKSIGLDVDWSLAYNYFSAGNTVGYNPKDYVYSQMTGPNSVKGDAINLQSCAYPYYTNIQLTELSDGTVPTQSGITIGETTFNYDGKPHSVTITAPSDAVISYSTDPSDDRAYSRVVPSLTNEGEIKVYYLIERTGYKNYSGSYTLKVKLGDRELALDDVSLTYDGAPHSIVLPDLIPGDRLTCLVNGQYYNEVPEFVMPGVYVYQITIDNDLLVSVSDSATLIIDPLVFDAPVVQGFNTLYDGAAHTLTVNLKETDATVEYAIDGGAFTATAPSFDDVGNHTVTVRISKTGYTTYEKTVNAIISPLPLINVGVKSYYGKADGNAHSGEMTGILEGDVLTYSLDGQNFTGTVPAFTQKGEYVYYVKINRKGHETVTFAVPVVLGDYDAPFEIEAVKTTGGIALTYTAVQQVLLTQNVMLISYGYYEEQVYTAGEQSLTGIMNVPATIQLRKDETAYGEMTFTFEGQQILLQSAKLV